MASLILDSQIDYIVNGEPHDASTYNRPVKQLKDAINTAIAEINQQAASLTTNNDTIRNNYDTLVSSLGGAAYKNVGGTDGVVLGNDTRLVNALQRSNNLSDLTDKAAARNNLGLGDVATRNVGTGTNDVLRANDPRVLNMMDSRDLLSDLTNTSVARSNLGLGNSATRNVGTSSGTVAAGNDSRLVNAVDKTKNLSDLSSATSARSNLGLGNSATRNVGTSSGTVAAGNDSRLVNGLQKASNLSDLPNKAQARTNLGLGSAALLNESDVVLTTNPAFQNIMDRRNNLSELTNKATARSNLGLGSIATRNASDFCPSTDNVWQRAQALPFITTGSQSVYNISASDFSSPSLSTPKHTISSSPNIRFLLIKLRTSFNTTNNPSTALPRMVIRSESDGTIYGTVYAASVLMVGDSATPDQVQRARGVVYSSGFVVIPAGVAIGGYVEGNAPPSGVSVSADLVYV